MNRLENGGSTSTEHPPRELTPRQLLEAARQEVLMLGANDFEPGAIDRIISEFEQEKVSFGAALRGIWSIRGGKYDYH